MKSLILMGLIAFAPIAGCQQPQVNPTPSPTSTPTTNLSPSPSPTGTASPTPSGAAWWKTANGVDLRACDNGVIENQGTPRCTAYGFAAIMTNLLCKKDRFSTDHIFSFYNQYSVDAAAQKVPGNNITPWQYWPENQGHTSDYLTYAKHQVTGMKYIDADDDIAYAMSVLDSGRPVYAGFSVPSDMASCYSIIRATSSITSGGHSTAILGYQLDPSVAGGGYWIIKQSWSDQCGDSGFQYMAMGITNNPKMYLYLYEPTSAK